MATIRKKVPPAKAGRKAAGGAVPRKAKAPRRLRGTGAALVYDSLKGLILELELQPRTLLDETQVSRQFGVSRSPVREALIRLSAEGLVQNLRNPTSIVAPVDADRAEAAGRADALVLVEEFKRDLSNRPAALLLLKGDR